MDEVKVPFVVNKLQSKDIYDYLASQGRIGLNELYVIQNDNDSTVSSVTYDDSVKKFYYTDSDGNNHDIVTLAVLKTNMNLSAVASNGSYNSLDNQPKINNVTLTGNKTTSDLNISYNDLANQPSIPQLTQQYNASDTSMAMTGKATATALNSYTLNTRSITGTGALSGGGNLTQDRTITHNAAPTGLTTAAVKVGVDSYGHTQVGAPITAVDVNAIPITYNVITSCQSIDAANYGTIMILGTQDETVSFTTVPPLGRRLRLYYVNVTNNNLTITINPANFSHVDYFFFNGSVLTSSTTYTVPANSNLTMIITLMQGTVEGATKVFCFADVQQTP